MDISDLLSNQNLAGFIITLAGQSILVSIIGITLIKLISKRPAPVQSLFCTGAVTALGLVFFLSPGFYLFNFAWMNTDITTFPKTEIPFVMPEFIQTIESPDSISASDGDIFPYSTGKNTDNPAMKANYIFKHNTLPVVSLINLAGFIWLIGILFNFMKLTYGIILLRKFRHELHHVNNEFYYTMLRTVARRFGKIRLPDLYTSFKLESPVTIGMLHPVVIIPEKLLSVLDKNELKSIFIHELAHIYHSDHTAGLFKRIILALHWWNPFMYVINMKHEQVREDISDNYVLSEMHPQIYTRCLVDLAEKACLISNFPTAVSMAGSNFNLRARVDNILSKKRNVTMGTKLYIKISIFLFFTLFTFGIASLQGKIQAGPAGLPDNIYHFPGQVIHPDTILKEIQNVETVKFETTDRDTTPANLIEERGLHEMPVALNNSEAEKSSVITVPVVTYSVKSHDIERLPNYQPDTPAAENAEEKQAVFIQKAVKKKPLPEKIIPEYEHEDAGTYIKQGKAEYKKHHLSESISAFSRAIELAPHNAETYYLRGNAFYKKTQFDKASADYTMAIDLDPEHVYAYAQRGLLYKIKDDYIRALADFDKAIELNPKSSLLYFERGNLRETLIKRHFQGLPVQDESFYNNYGGISSKTYKLVIEDYKKALKLNPESSYINDRIKSVYKIARAGLHNEGIKLLNRGAELLNDHNDRARSQEIRDSINAALTTEKLNLPISSAYKID